MFRSNEVEIEQWLIGATPRALVLSSLEVWSPASGETLEPAPVHQAAGRPVPDHHFSTSALYLPATREWLAFEAEVTLVRRTGGIHRVDRAAGRRLWSPVSATLLGTYDRVEAMAPGADGRFALLALRQETRGPSSVAVAVLVLGFVRVQWVQVVLLYTWAFRRIPQELIDAARLEGAGAPMLFSNRHACPQCGYSVPLLEPKAFSFNSPAGACTACDGLGFREFFAGMAFGPYR